MSGFEVAASIIGVAVAGCQVTKALCEFNRSLAEARDDIEDIEFEVSTFSQTLRLLADRLKDDAEIVSGDGILQAQSISNRANKLFVQIRSSLPPSQGSTIAAPMSTTQRLKWHFKKERVKCHVKQLQHLKLTLSILLQALLAGRAIFQARKTHDQSKESEIKIESESVQLIDLMALRQRQTRDLDTAKQIAEQSEENMINTTPSPPPDDFVPLGTRSNALVRYEKDAISRIESALEEAYPDQTHAVILRDDNAWSNSIINMLTNALDKEVSIDSDSTRGTPPAGLSLKKGKMLCPRCKIAFQEEQKDDLLESQSESPPSEFAEAGDLHSDISDQSEYAPAVPKMQRSATLPLSPRSDGPSKLKYSDTLSSSPRTGRANKSKYYIVEEDEDSSDHYEPTAADLFSFAPVPPPHPHPPSYYGLPPSKASKRRTKDGYKSRADRKQTWTSTSSGPHFSDTGAEYGSSPDTRNLDRVVRQGQAVAPAKALEDYRKEPSKKPSEKNLHRGRRRETVY